MKAPVLILGAMDGEIKAFLDYFEIIDKKIWKDYCFYSGKAGETPIILAKTGIGKTLSATITQKLIDLYSPSALIFTGIAGSLSNKLNVGDMVIGRDSIQHDIDATLFNFKRGEIPYTKYRIFKSDDTLFNSALSYSPVGHNITAGRILTGDQFISKSSGNDYSYLKEELDGDCVEMEGASVALVASINDLPHIIIRTISDNVDEKIKINIKDFLKIASKNSLGIVNHILSTI